MKMLKLNFVVICMCVFSISGNSQQISQLVRVDTLVNDNLGIRTIVKNQEELWFGGKKGNYGFIDLNQRKIHRFLLQPDSLDIRSMSQNSEAVFLLNAGSPAKLMKIDKKTKVATLVYEENHPKAFYDSMKFWNEKEGIAMGDPIGHCFSILITKDGGNTWNKIDCSQLPKLEMGEAAFAASNTNIVVKGNETWLVSGGSNARVFYSPDKAKTWKIYDTPIQKGKTMTGIFTSDFYNSKIGMIAGGNYEKPESNVDNKAITTDGGKTWKVIAQNKAFGYASCIKAIPETQGKEWICVGATGVFYTKDSGNTWGLIYKNYDLFTLEVISKSEIYASGRNYIVKINADKL